MNYVKWFLIGLVLGTATTGGAIVQTRNKADSLDSATQLFYSLYKNVQSKQYRIEYSTPTINLTAEQEVFILKTGGKVKLVTRIGNTLHYFSED